MASNKQRPASNVTSMPQAGDTFKGKTVLQDTTALSALDQIKALMANLSPEERKQLGSQFQAPKYDTAKLLAIKAKMQETASKLMFDTFGENVDGKEAFGIIWKAAWPKKYYELDAQGNRVKLANGAFSSWVPGGKANSKERNAPWIATGHYQLVRLTDQGEVVETNGDEQDDE